MTSNNQPEDQRKSLKIGIALFSILALAAIVLSVYALVQLRERKTTHIADKDIPLSFMVMAVHADEKDQELILPSYLVAMNISPIWARVNGYLKNFHVDIGDRVKKGQLLAEIDVPDIEEQVMQAEGELASFIAKENIASITAARWTQLYERNPEAISAEEVDQMVTAYQAAIGDTAAAKGNLGYLQTLQDFKHIYAPFDGIITTRDIDIGYLITLGSNNNPLGYPEEFNQNKALFQIARCDVLRAFVDVPQPCFYLIKDGMSAEVRIPEYPEKVFRGVIDRNAKSLDPLARTLLTQINIDNSNGQLVPGLYAEVKMKFKPERKTYIVPIAAVIIRSGPPYIAIVKHGHTVHLQEVKIGRDYGDAMEIIAGLSDDDVIITNPTDRIKEGIYIEPIPLSVEEPFWTTHCPSGK